MTLAMIGAVFFLPPIPQSDAYHHFADTRKFLLVPNFWNVVSNLPFVLVACAGLYTVLHRKAALLDQRERWPYLVFFASVGATAFGSAFYHLNPNNSTLVWDRLPMALGFMALLSAVISERIDAKLGTSFLSPLVLLGAASVLYWSVTQSHGHGDLRPYGLVQFGSAVVLLLLVALFRSPYTRSADLVVALAIYAVAKACESADRVIFSLGGIISGHTLKHLAAAISAYLVAHMLARRALRAHSPVL